MGRFGGDTNNYVTFRTGGIQRIRQLVNNSRPDGGNIIATISGRKRDFQKIGRVRSIVPPSPPSLGEEMFVFKRSYISEPFLRERRRIARPS